MRLALEWALVILMGSMFFTLTLGPIIGRRLRQIRLTTTRAVSSAKDDDSTYGNETHYPYFLKERERDL